MKTNPTDGQPYVWIPAGTFNMGCSAQDVECEKDEAPKHPATVSKGFWLGQTEVTNAAYQRFAATKPKPAAPPRNLSDFFSKFFGEPGAAGSNQQAGKAKEQTKTQEAPAASDPRVPASMVNWSQAGEYCSWAAGRLPSEAEWEYAARAGDERSRYGELDKVAWYAGNSGQRPLELGGPKDGDRGELLKQLETHGNKASEVSKKQPNPWGLFDMLGNLWEWVSDWYQEDYYQQSPRVDPNGPASGPGRSLRGGAFSSYAVYVRSSYRNWMNPDVGIALVGFRCAWEPKSP